MKKYCFLATMMFALSLASCEKAPMSPIKGPDTPQPINPADTVISPKDSLGRYISVIQAKYYAETAMFDSIEVNGIVGYIVGAINGTSLLAADFTPPFTAKSNILIADNPLENNVDKCMPVQLEKDTRFRDELNLADNPENFGKKLIVEGVVSDYFRTYGIKPLTEYAWVTASSDTTKTDSSKNNPVISPDPEIIEGGR